MLSLTFMVKKNEPTYLITWPDAPKGDPRNPLSFDDIVEKFKDLPHPILSEGRMNQIIVLVQNLENLENFSKLIKLCCVNPNSSGRMKA
jgi:2-methylcitrate dehydratase PrpD